jgi:hypothetical protein
MQFLPKRISVVTAAWLTKPLVLALLVAAGPAPAAEVSDATEPRPDASFASQDAAPGAAPKARDRLKDPEDGQFDLSYFLENPRGFLPIPIVVTEPAVGYGGGGAGMFLRPRREAGAEGWARPDISAVGAIATENGTWGAFAGDSSRWLDGRLRTLAGVGTGQVNLDFYGLRPDRPSPDERVRYELRFSGAVAQANWQLAPGSPWAIGLRYVHADVEPRLREQGGPAGLLDRISVKVSAPTAILEFDSRDNVFTPTRGIYAESAWMAAREALGSSDDFESFQQILMGWQEVGRQVTLGARGNYAWSSDGTPFFLRPFVQLRGVAAMRYQGDQMASLEAELRWQLRGRWSLVGFAGTGATRTSRDAFVATQNVGSGGLGLRYLLARKFGLHAGIDVAHSPGTTAIYLQVGNAWFRP